GLIDRHRHGVGVTRPWLARVDQLGFDSHGPTRCVRDQERFNHRSADRLSPAVTDRPEPAAVAEPTRQGRLFSGIHRTGGPRDATHGGADRPTRCVAVHGYESETAWLSAGDLAQPRSSTTRPSIRPASSSANT